MNREKLEERAEKALLYLHGGAAKHAEARAHHDYMQGWIKHEKARIKAGFPGLSQVAAEDAALNSDAYKEALNAAREASELWYEVQFRREAAVAVIDAWRTACSNERAHAG